MAPEVQGSSADSIAELVKDEKIEYAVTKGISGPSLGNTIPRMAVFDVSGRMVFSGHPMNKEAERAIKDALKEVEGGDSSSSSLLPPRLPDLVPLRSWTNSDGKTLEAALVRVEGGTGYFKMSNGRTFEYEIGKFSARDQDVVSKATAAGAE